MNAQNFCGLISIHQIKQISNSEKARDAEGIPGKEF
jgi:hypothetical protein